MRFASRVAIAALAGASTALAGITLNINDPQSIATAAGQTIPHMLDWYIGNQPGQAPGTVAQPYYWWECGEMLGALIDYWYYTNDTQYNDLVKTALLFQTGPDNDYMPPNQTRDEGNDDQIFWGFAVMSAAEYNFPNPAPNQPQWIELAEGVFNSQKIRWDNATCNGGLRWQIFTFNNGYNYKNMPSNGGFMNLAARLYAYTGNTTYSDWVYAAWDWLEGVGMISSDYSVYDGVTPSENCTSIDHDQWSYSAGMVLNTAAVMWAMTNETLWKTRTQGVWSATTGVFFNEDKIMMEAECESQGNCDDDEKSFKSTFSRFIAASTKWAPFLYDQVKPYLEASAVAAAQQCDGQPGGNACGLRWTMGTTWDGTTGLGQQMDALEVIQSNLIQNSTPPVTETKGGTSKGNKTYGLGGDPNPTALPPVTSGDRAGAGILTALVLIFVLGGAWWVLG